MGMIPLRKVMTRQILQKFLAFKTLEVLLLYLRDKLGRFPGPNELSPRAETLPKVNLDDKSKYNLSMHNFKWQLRVLAA